MGLSTLVDNLSTALATSRAEVERLNGELTTVRDELTAVRTKVTRSADSREVQQLVT